MIAGKPFFEFCRVQQFFRLGVKAFVVTLDDTNGDAPNPRTEFGRIAQRMKTFVRFDGDHLHQIIGVACVTDRGQDQPKHVVAVFCP